jgi:hypothetical protein
VLKVVRVLKEFKVKLLQQGLKVLKVLKVVRVLKVPKEFKVLKVMFSGCCRIRYSSRFRYSSSVQFQWKLRRRC